MSGDAHWKNKELTLRGLDRVYHEFEGEWLLLEILEEAPDSTPARFRLHAHSRCKDELREFMMDHEEWDWRKRYLFVLADPGGDCTLNGAS